MKSIPVKSSRGAYRIVTGRRLLEKAGNLLRRAGFKKGKVLIVTQRGVARRHGPRLVRSLKRAGFDVFFHYLPEGERAKSEAELSRIYRTLLAHDFERRDAVFAFGGGVAGDVAGFAAATYLRGIAFFNAGTTLLAQVDSSIGGKTGINLPAGKNLAGAFYPARLVISDAETLKTLPPREFAASLGEVVKYGVISDRKLFRLLESKAADVLRREPRLLEKIVTACARIKAGVVSRDEHETRGERMILNFGHTFGHGIEKALGFRKWLHGEAVAAGMVCAARLARDMKKFSAGDVQKIIRLLIKLGLPVSLAGLNLGADEIMQAMRHDKKKSSGRLRYVLPVKIGKVRVVENIPPGLIRKILIETGAQK